MTKGDNLIPEISMFCCNKSTQLNKALYYEAANENILLFGVGVGFVCFYFLFPPCKFIKNAYLELKMKLIIKFEV